MEQGSVIQQDNKKLNLYNITCMLYKIINVMVNRKYKASISCLPSHVYAVSFLNNYISRYILGKIRC